MRLTSVTVLVLQAFVIRVVCLFDLREMAVWHGSRRFAGLSRLMIGAACVTLGLSHGPVSAQVKLTGLTVEETNDLFGLAPLANSSVLPTAAPRLPNDFWSVLLKQTDGLMNGKINFPYLIPLTSATPNSLSMQTQSILDAPYTRPNLYQLADGYGTKLGRAYQSQASWQNPSSPYSDSKQAWAEISPAVTKLIWFTGTRLRVSNLQVRSILGTGTYYDKSSFDFSLLPGVQNAVMARAFGLPADQLVEVTAYTPTPNARIYPTGSYTGHSAPPGCDPTGKDAQSCGPVSVNSIVFKTGGINVRPFEVAAYSHAKGLGLELAIPSFEAFNYNTDLLVNPSCKAGASQDQSGCANYNSNFAYFFDDGGESSPRIGFDEQLGSSSYSSGHAIYGWYAGLVMGLMVPEAFQKMQTRGAENALGRVIGGWHWPTDVIGSRTLSYFGVAQMLAGEEGYYGNADQDPYYKVPNGIGNQVSTPYANALSVISVNPADCTGSGGGAFVCIPKGDIVAQNSGYVQVLQQAQQDMARALTAQCASSLQACADADTSRFADKEINRSFYEATLTLGLPRVYSESDLAGYSLDFNNFAPGNAYMAWRGAAASLIDEQRYAKNAGYLLLTRFPYLSLEQRNDVLTTTVTADADARGSFLDNGSAYGAYSRINLFKAADGYARFDSNVTVNMDAALGGFHASDTWSNDISGPGGLVKNGTGALVLAGKNTFSGPISVNGGRLDIVGSVLTSAGVVVNGGVIGGSGKLPNLTVNATGAIAPGNSIGTLSPAAFSLNGGTLQAEIQGPNADLVAVSGTVSAFTGTATLAPYGGGTPFPGFIYTLVTAPNSADFVTANSLNLNQVQVASALLQAGATLVQNPLANPRSFAVLWRPNGTQGVATAAMQATGQTSANTLSVAGSLDKAYQALAMAANGNANNSGVSIGSTGFTTGQAAAAGLSSGFVQALNALVLIPSAGQLASALTSLTPQPYAAFQSVGLETLKQQRESLLSQSGQCLQNGWIINGKESRQPVCAFALAQNSSTSVQGGSTLSSYNAGIFSSGFGLEYYPSQQWSLGIAYGYGSSYANGFSQLSASLSADVNSINLFATYNPSERWRLRGLFGYSNFNLNGSRSLTALSAGSTLVGDTAANGFTAAIEADYSLSLSHPASVTQVKLRPMLGLAWGGYQQAGFSETGAPLALSVEGHTANSLVATVGAELATSPVPLNHAKTLRLRPSLLVAYQVDALANNISNKSLTASFTEAPSVGAFSAEGQNLGGNALNISGGLDLLMGDRTSLYVNASYQAYSNASQFGYGGGVRVRF